MKEKGAGGVLSAGGGAEDANPGQVERRIVRRGGLHPPDAVCEAGVFEVLPANIVKRFGAMGGPHSVDLDDDESQVVERAVAVARRERLGDEGALRAGVN